VGSIRRIIKFINYKLIFYICTTFTVNLQKGKGKAIEM